MVRQPLVLGIETSCDDTACAVLDGSGRVLSSVVGSQIAAHLPYGGVVPEIASREHLANWLPVSQAALAKAGVTAADLGLIAATRGPGLVGALLVGLSLGKSLAYALGRPFYAVHHLEGHLYSPFLALPGAGDAAEVPASFHGLILSGGHSGLFAVARGQVETLGETRDDAFGEVFDKVGKRLGLPYPQGPLVDALAEKGDPRAFRLPIPACGATLDLSYSGLKSRALTEIERLESQIGPFTLTPGASGASGASGVSGTSGASDHPGGAPPDQAASPDRSDAATAAVSTADSLPQPVLDLLASFRQAAVAQVLDRLDRLAATGWRPPALQGSSSASARALGGPAVQTIPGGQAGPAEQTWSAVFRRLLAVSGGAAANRLLRRELPLWCARHGVELRLVPLVYAGDNAAMIAFAALQRHALGHPDNPFTAEAESRIPFALPPSPA